VAIAIWELQEHVALSGSIETVLVSSSDRPGLNFNKIDESMAVTRHVARCARIDEFDFDKGVS